MTNLSSWVDPRVSLVRAETFKAYLLKHGWGIDPRTDAKLMVFQGPVDDDGEPIILTLPASERLKDWRYNVPDRIGLLGILEGRNARDVLEEILGQGQAGPINGAAANKAKRVKQRM